MIQGEDYRGEYDATIDDKRVPVSDTQKERGGFHQAQHTWRHEPGSETERTYLSKGSDMVVVAATK